MHLYFWLVDLPLCMIPAGIAAKRKCKNQAAIYCLSFFLSWTIIGGIIAIIWAVTGETIAQSEPDFR